MDDAQLATQTRFWVAQKFTLMVNRYTDFVYGYPGWTGNRMKTASPAATGSPTGRSPEGWTYTVSNAPLSADTRKIVQP